MRERANLWNCSSLTGTLTLPANLSTIGQGAFYKTGYDTLVFSAGVTEIGKSSFSNCKSLTELRFPGAMSGNCVIGETAFNACSALVSVTLPEGVTALEVSSFQLCRGLTSIALPGSLRTIDALAFGWCDSLTEIIVPEGVSTIGRRAFSGCKSLVHATFPASVQSIGGLAFINCQSVKLYILGANTTIDSETLNGEEVTDFFNPNNAFYGAVYCIQGSPADALASEKGYTVRYIDPETGLESVREVETEYAHLWLPLGATRQMGASLYPPVEGAVFAFTSCQPDIVSVEASQEDPSVVNLTGLAPGVARVTITSPDSSIVTEVTVDVYRPVDDFAISAAAWMFPGDSAQLTVVNVLPDGAEGDFFWWSSDDSVATVTKNGVVSGHNPGEATITAQNGEMARTTTVHVNAPLDYLRFDFEAIVLKQGRATQLFSDLPWLEEHSVNRLVVFSSADESVAAVDQLGWVTAVGRGITTIRVQDYNDPTVYVDCAAVVLSPNPQKLLLPGNLNAIEAEAFYGVAGAEIAVIPDSCGSIGGNAFTGCDSLLLVSLPKDISIAGSAFDDDGQWAFVCPPGGTAAAYAAQKGRMCFESVIWISDEDSVLAE